MTPAQEKFLMSLISSRVIPAEVATLDLATLTVPQASRLIDTLKDAPWKSRDIQGPWMLKGAAAPAIAEKGYYRFNGEIYTVVAARLDKSKSYAKVLVSEGNRGRWEYVRGMVSQLRAQDRITVEQAKEFGHLHGFCLVCGKILTDPKSVSQGIGPVCIKRI